MVNKSFVFRFDGVEVREREFTLIKAGKLLTVEPKAFRALLFLLHNPQKLISKKELLDAVWGDTAVTEGSLTRCIWLLRQLLGDDIHDPRYIETVSTVGYRFIGRVEASEDGPGEPAAIKEPDDFSGRRIGNRKRLSGWALSGGVVLIVCLTAAIWYSRRPLAQLQVTGYTQITHDGHEKYLVGTDGNRLYFNQPFSIAQAAISGGETAQISVSLPNPVLLDVSPDGSSELVVSHPRVNWALGPLWNVRAVGNSIRRLGDAVSATFSPDGKWVVYSTADSGNWGGIYLVRSDGTGAHKLASAEDRVDGLAWSPGDAVIRFDMWTKRRIWEMASNGSNLHEFLPGWHSTEAKCCGRWTPDGRFFLFLMEGQIWALDERRTLFRQRPAEPVQLTTGPILWGSPIPSKDGRRIFAQGVTPHGELSRFDAKAKKFLPFLGGISAQGVSFSNDGKSIAYVSYPEGTLWKANWDGSDPVQLSDAPFQVFLPRWSPDGSQIAFTVTTEQDFGIYIVSAEGGSLRKLLPGDHSFNLASTWSPDGRKIVFNSELDRRIDGRVITRILDLDSNQVSTVPGSDGMNGPRWSPDGRYLAAGSEDGLHLMIFNFTTQQWSELTQKGPIDSPEWSRNGQFIYFKRVVGDRGVFRIRVNGGAVEKLADLKDWHDAGWYGAWMGLDTTDSPLLLRDIASADIYALTLDWK
jgi:Tol biopolymer transport system component/DNA-binding winged helix-turn-helix (wHTH) protein